MLAVNLVAVTTVTSLLLPEVIAVHSADTFIAIQGILKGD